MRRSRDPQDRDSRARLVNEAARLFVDLKLENYHQAKCKALQSLGMGDDVQLPSNDEIELAVLDYQRLFKSDSQPVVLQTLRTTALKAMRSLKEFSPKLAGPVLSGTADEFSRISLHLFADPAESVVWHLMDRHVRFDAGERRLRLGGTQIERLPTYDVVFDDLDVELVVFSGRQRRQHPLGVMDGKPLPRAGLVQVEALLKELRSDA